MTIAEAVTVPSVTMMTSTVSEASLARDTHTQTRVVYVKVCFANNERGAITGYITVQICFQQLPLSRIKKKERQALTPVFLHMHAFSLLKKQLR